MEEAKKGNNDDNAPEHFFTDKEAMFYKDDVEFMRFHKRTSKNVHETLSELLESSKQAIYTGIKQTYSVSINYVELNRSCSVVNAWWSINQLDSN